MSKQRFLRGTFILTCTGLASRVIGFFYRIFLSHTIGAEGLGLYQLIVPLQGIVLAVTAAGVQTALSRLIASRMALGRDREGQELLFVGTFFAVFLSVLAGMGIYLRADFFAAEILKEARTAGLLRILAFSFPLCALHTCINSYYFAGKRTGIPSGLQLLEQAVRVGASYLIYLVILSENRPVTAMIAMGGALAGELAAALTGVLVIGTQFRRQDFRLLHLEHPAKHLSEILQTSVPLTLNRVLLTLLAGIEVVLIPQRLRLSGLNSSDALAVYGVFTGMALPMILFPSTVTGSASVMLMPSIAEMQALGRQSRIRQVTGQACTACMVLGSVCALGFFLLGPWIGKLLFHSPTAGIYIRTMAFICPFLYLNTALVSILNGLGRTTRCLIHSVSGTLLRISFVLFAIPVMGIRGYLYGLLFSEILLSGLHLFALYRSR